MTTLDYQARALRRVTGCSLALARRLVRSAHEEMRKARSAGQRARRAREWQPDLDVMMTEAEVREGFAELRARLTGGARSA